MDGRKFTVRSTFFPAREVCCGPDSGDNSWVGTSLILTSSVLSLSPSYLSGELEWEIWFFGFILFFLSLFFNLNNKEISNAMILLSVFYSSY